MTNKICDGCETVAHCLKNVCVPKTSKQTEALKLALGYMDGSLVTDHLTGYERKRHVMEAICEALTSGASEDSSGTEQPAQPQQEPVAWMDLHKELSTFKWDGYSEGWNRAIESVKEYLVDLAHTSPPTLSLAQRQSRSDVKPLPGEQIVKIAAKTLPKVTGGMSFVPEWAVPLARAIEAAHDIRGSNHDQ